MALQEFDIIRRFFTDIGPADDGLGAIGDDCATLDIPAGFSLQVSVDTLNADVHFPATAPAELIATRAFACCVSDLAAAGAKPWCFTLALSLPEAQESWLSAFARGLQRAASASGARLVGGDTTRGPLALTLQVMGLAATGAALRRGGAVVADDIWLTGETGLARAALELPVLASPAAASDEQRCYLDAYYRPRPVHGFAHAIAGCVSAAVDISDGLLADLQHVLAASRCGATIDVKALPVHSQLRDDFGEQRALDFALAGGDDYQLLLTAPTSSAATLEAQADRLGIKLTRIGEITEGDGVNLKHLPKGVALPARAGYQHFAADADA